MSVCTAAFLYKRLDTQIGRSLQLKSQCSTKINKKDTLKLAVKGLIQRAEI